LRFTALSEMFKRRGGNRIKARLRVRAAEHGHSMEEAREILRKSLIGKPDKTESISS
jgi:plasmid stability protein